jgi:integrase
MRSEIDTIPKRARLPSRKNPYWTGISGGRGGVSLGYRKPARGTGSWIAKIVLDGQRIEERLGHADDDGAAPGSLGYRAAVTAALHWSKRQHAGIEGRKETASTGRGPTVGSAVDAYIAARTNRSPKTGANAKSRLTQHVLSDEGFSGTLLSKLRAGTIEAWRTRITDDINAGVRRLAPATLNRLLNDLRAALNAAAEKHRRELPAYLAAEIKVGTRAVSVSGDARKQLLTDDEVRRIVDAAFQVDEDGDFGRLILLAAATGARFSQLTALTVADAQPTRSRVMMPGSKKGRGAKAKAPVAVPLTEDAIGKLKPILRERGAREPLLTRWAYRRAGSLKWEKDKRRPWGQAYEVDKDWAATVKAAEVAPDTIMYALRHSSIVRGLRAGLPVRLVAALHDTSSEMIETHYSAYIVDATEELSRRAALSFSNSSMEAAE